MTKPDFFIVGAPKCGTTSLFSYLSRHPEVFLCAVKEPQFFAGDVLGSYRNVQTEEEYLRCFANARGAKRVGEASVAYLGSRTAAADIKAFNPAARIIVMLRNPVDMMYSLHSERIFENGEQVVDFAAALRADEDSGRGIDGVLRPPGLTYRETARYAPQVRRYLEVFGRENVMIIIFEDFQHDTGLVYENVLRFLDVRTGLRPRFAVVNSNHRVRNRRMQQFLESPPAPVRKLAHALTVQPLRRLVGNSLIRINTAYERRPPMDPELKRHLSREVAPEIQELSEIVGRDLSYWCRG